MSKTEQSNGSEKEIVAVTKHGQATIPKRFREKLGIEAPGKVLFRETEDGEILVEQIRSPSEMRGFAARSEASTDKPASEILREKREQDREARDAQFVSEK
ncbi:AbrB/MazE/SpoVT family DNA-binding domain-containing protein [Salinarchaeum sp. IM2453]|uniref:AbrB/MazE/SpoVT family DNA-binding domain-containing protein n=1 Tax=Salinarchaeum sp. IM2453 TaxID=2862870 RepID=UPI001C82C8D6|nr:AbrB/MazE/SpoVT family DNA-binding domain-containing protein [Salinarchaeum sp. IM2453]QZA89104.1 AbrB/MazE/SpoVT family DNA-binding domain-containing protein [Salinarchaeum sp. IM2453]